MKPLALCAAAVIASVPASAWAASCKVYNYGTIDVIPYQELTFPAFKPAVFDPNVPDGTILYEAKGSATSKQAQVTCQWALGVMEYKGVGTYNDTYGTYPTSVSGIGYRLKGGYNANEWWPQTTGNNTTLSSILNAGGDFTIQLIKTGAITATGTLSGLVGTTSLASHDNQIVRRVSFTGGLPIKPTVPTCTVQKSAIGVPLGFVTMLTLDKDGASPYKSFPIDLNCSGGSTGTATRMFITLTDATDPDNRSGQLSLSSTGAGAAKGVAVEIRRASDDSIVKFGPDSADANNPNQWFVGQFGNTGVSIPLKARYVKTATTVTPGEANAKATFTMSYQ